MRIGNNFLSPSLKAAFTNHQLWEFVPNFLEAWEGFEGHFLFIIFLDMVSSYFVTLCKLLRKVRLLVLNYLWKYISNQLLSSYFHTFGRLRKISRYLPSVKTGTIWDSTQCLWTFMIYFSPCLYLELMSAAICIVECVKVLCATNQEQTHFVLYCWWPPLLCC